jgi:two-component system sensor histidine kinase EvgS
VVDDNHANQILLRQQLKHLGHDVSVRSNGLEALRALASHPFDLVITDCQMPVMDGFDLTRNLRALAMTCPSGASPPMPSLASGSFASPPA